MPNDLTRAIDLRRYAAEFPSLQFFSGEPGILELVMSNQGRLNAATEDIDRKSVV